MGRKRINTDRVTSNAERCKRYREANKEMYRLSDAIRKRHFRSVTSTNIKQNVMRLKEQALKKSIYRQRRKMEKASLEVSARESSQMISDFEEAGSAFQTSSNAEKTEPYRSPSTSFRTVLSLEHKRSP